MAEKDNIKVTAFLEADLCGSTDLKEEFGEKIGARITQLHNIIVKSQIERCKKNKKSGMVLKEIGDAVIIAFTGDQGINACIRTAVRIQQAFNLYNLLFSTRTIMTKIALVSVGIDSKSIAYFSNAILQNDEWKKIKILDFLGRPLDLLARILNLAKPGEILLSDQAVDAVNARHSSPKKCLKISKFDPKRHTYLKGIGPHDVGILQWKGFPANLKKIPYGALNMSLSPISKLLSSVHSEIIGIIPYNDMETHLGTISLQIEQSTKSGLPLLSKSSNVKKLFEKQLNLDNISDILVIGHALLGWAKELSNKKIIKNKIKLHLLKMSPKQITKSTTPKRDHAELINRMQKAKKKFQKLKKNCKEHVKIKTAKIPIEGIWTFRSLNGADIFKEITMGRDEIIPYKLPYRHIGSAYRFNKDEINEWRDLCKNQNKNYKKVHINDKEFKKWKSICKDLSTQKTPNNNLPIQIANNDIVFGANKRETIIFIYCMDWLQAATKPSTSYYFLARKRFEVFFSSVTN